MLRLGSQDLQAVSSALEVILNPARSGGSAGYRRSVLDVLKPLVGADKACYVTYEGEKATWVADYPQARLSDYGVRLEDVAPGVDIWERHEALGVTRRDELWLPICPHFYETAYYRDYVTPLRAFDGMGVNWRRGPGRHSENMVKILVHHDSQKGPRFTDREYHIMRLLRPALVSGLAHEALGVSEKPEVFESLPDPTLVVDSSGVALDANQAARELMNSPRAERAIRDALRRVFGGAAGSSWGEALTVPPPAVRVRELGMSARLRLTRMDLGAEGGTGYLASLTGYDLVSEDFAALAEQKGLTRRQAQVASLLAERLRSREIADRLGIAVSTVRRHEEQVFLRLGVKRRTDVAAALFDETSTQGRSST